MEITITTLFCLFAAWLVMASPVVADTVDFTRLAALWQVDVLDTVAHEDGNGVDLTFSHGFGRGTAPGLQIYGATAIDEQSDLTGSSCRSLGGLEVATDGLGISQQETNDFSSIVAITIDSDAIASNANIYKETSEGSVIQFCVLYYLSNENNQVANFAEVEIRLSQAEDGTIQFHGPDTTVKPPHTSQIETTQDATAALCEDELGETKHQGDVFSICIQPSDPSMTVDLVAFTFEADDGALQQQAFVDGTVADSFTALGGCDACSFSFHTMLRAEFYIDGPKTVTGYGTVTMTRGRRLLTEEENKRSEVMMEFVVGESVIVQQLLKTEKQTMLRKQHERRVWGPITSAALVLILFAILLVSWAKRKATPPGLSALEIEPMVCAGAKIDLI